MKIRNKKGITLNEGVIAVLTLVLIGVLIIVALVLFTNFQSSAPLSTGRVIVNESMFINGTGKGFLNASNCGAEQFAVIVATNGSSGRVIQPANYSVSGTTLINLTSISWDKANVTYSFYDRGDTCNAATNTITQFLGYPLAVGLIGTVILLGIAIGVLMMWLGSRKTKA